MRRGEIIPLQAQVEHLQPRVFARNERQSNVAAACQICNQLKSDRIFTSLEEIRRYLARRRRQLGYTVVQVPDPLPPSPIKPETPVWQLQCLQCQQRFETPYEGQRFCSIRCRQQSYWNRRVRREAEQLIAQQSQANP